MSNWFIEYNYWHVNVWCFSFYLQNRLTALSQYDDMAYIPNIIRFKGTIQKKILSFFNAHIKRAIEDHDNYLIDVFVAPNQVQGWGNGERRGKWREVWRKERRM